MMPRRLLVISVLVAIGLAAWLLWPSPRAVPPREPPVLSDIVNLSEWRVDEAIVGPETVLRFKPLTKFACVGEFQTDAKEWSNVASAGRRSAQRTYTKPFLHVEGRFAEAGNDEQDVRIVRSSALRHSRPSRGDVRFQGTLQTPVVPGEYHLYLSIGVEPAESPLWSGLPYEWHIIGWCRVEVLEPVDE